MDWEELARHGQDLHVWLIEQQPADDTRANWWLGWVLVAVGRVQEVLDSGGIPARATLDLVVRVIDLATDQGAVSSADRVIRLANLAGLIAGVRGADVPSALEPDEAASRCLELIPIDVSEAEVLASDWHSLPIDRIRSLRRLRNLIDPMLRLEPQLRDRRVVLQVAEWRAVRASLP